MKPKPGQGVFFLLWPLFARAPRHWFLEFFLLSAPGVQSVFFFVALRWAPRPFGGARAKKKNTTQGVFFLLRPRGKAGEVEAPCRHGARAKKKHHPGCFFFAAAPAKGKRRRSPVGRRHGARAKKKTPPRVLFFAPALGKGRARRSPVGRRHGASPSPASPRGRSTKKNTPGWCFFFCCGPARTLTHSLRAWVAMPPPRRGGVFFFAVAPPGPGWCFFVLLWPRPDAHSLTVGWGDFGKARVVFFFFAAAPPGLFRQ